ncbi:ethanolamine ammonia-lyase reactivating factor EutA [Terrilactibacillus laevilacticus]|uniref:Ethanolamine ammonia-lyase reactivating factor EutA n=1 Tax=Terrilactibacillus laevilacticus TaxID=1380157 RepID=A0ABW5PLN0_9BACI|nr:ethanolamine ammonia-lyase reactivating factor EutA [Terrilactibacillus laevilacticus]
MHETNEWITSLGIDLGTSTTKFIVSRLQISKVSSAFSLPSYKITKRLCTYKSQIYSTPLIDDETIDYTNIAKILEREYEEAGITLDDVHTGAVIITGETANKKNARIAVNQLAERAGDFVVATAGAELESLLAGKGSGAQDFSIQTPNQVVANIDIGGGTANTAFFLNGECIGTATLRIGGRLIRLNPAGFVKGMADSFKPWLEENGFLVKKGDQISFERIKQITDEMAKNLIGYLAQSSNDEHTQLLYIDPMPQSLPTVHTWMFSGGVGELMKNSERMTLEEGTRYGDIGPFLATSLNQLMKRSSFNVLSPKQTVRATVIGAGTQTTEISGSTVFIQNGNFPIRNVPVEKVHIQNEELQSDQLDHIFSETIKKGLSLHSMGLDPAFALYLSGIDYCSYEKLKKIVNILENIYSQYLPNQKNIVIICQNDMAKALGHALSIRLNGKVNCLICIDQINIQHGDYIDIGQPLPSSIIPIIVKTLVFTSDA